MNQRPGNSSEKLDEGDMSNALKLNANFNYATLKL